jgi:hypothetical protein
MKPQTEMIEGPEVYTRFEETMKRVLSVRSSDIKKAALDPNKRGPKPRNQSRAAV